MAHGYCEDCGTGLEANGVCPNCHEELFISEWQGMDMPEEVSQEFYDLVEQQRAEIKRQRELRETM